MKCSCILFAGIFFFATRGTSQLPDSVLSKAQSRFGFEKLYLHHDKQVYGAGETIWLKAYLQEDGIVVSGSSLKVQLLDTKGLIIAQQLFPVFNGISVGQIPIPKGISSGRYFIRAFTNTIIRKQDPSLCFVQPVVIRNDTTNFQTKPPFFRNQLKASWSTALRPVLNSVLNEVSFSVTDQFYQSIAADIYLITGTPDTICSARTSLYGTGKLIFTPIPGQKYTAIVCTEKDTLRYFLPKAAEGVQLLASPVGEKYFISIDQTAGNKDEPFSILGEMNYTSVFTQQLNNKKQQNITLSVDSLPNGILRLVVLDKENKELTEKYVYIYHSDTSIVFNENKITIRPLVDSVIFSNYKSQAADGNLSISFSSIADERDNIYPKQNISARLGFTAYFKELLPDANALFTKENARLIQNIANDFLSALAIRKPSWTEMQNSLSTVPDTTEYPSYLYFKGTITNRKNEAIRVKTGVLNLILQTNDSASKYWSIPLGQNGGFSEDGLLFTDSAKIYYQFTGDLDNDKDIHVSSPPSLLEELVFNKDDLSFINNYPDLTVSLQDKNDETKLKDTATTKQVESGSILNNVTVTGYKTLRQKTKELEKRYTKGLFTKETPLTLNFLDDAPPNTGMSVKDYLLQKYPQIFGSNISAFNLYLNEGFTTEDELSHIYTN
jgi:hypothetical protein